MNKTSSVVGLLALQGDYQKHAEILSDIGVDNIEVRKADSPERRQSLNRRRHLKLFRRIGEAGKEMSQLFNNAADWMVS